jgi:hypothetical protein
MNGYMSSKASGAIAFSIRRIENLVMGSGVGAETGLASTCLMLGAGEPTAVLAVELFVSRSSWISCKNPTFSIRGCSSGRTVEYAVLIVAKRELKQVKAA